MTTGITTENQHNKAILYSEIFDEYCTSTITLRELGEKYGLTRQRVSQIIIRCRVGKGDYYKGGEKAKELWNTISEENKIEDELDKTYRRELFRSTLETNFGIKISKNNHKFTLLLGRNYAKRKPTLEATAG